MKEKRRTSENLIFAEEGLLDDMAWKPYLSGLPTALVQRIRSGISDRVPGVKEKFNKHPDQKYFGYWKDSDKDRVYIYVNEKTLTVDLFLHRRLAKQIKDCGFTVIPRENHQGRQGWVTGWQIPQSREDIEAILYWICNAFKDTYKP